MKGPSVPLVSSQVTPAVPIPSPSKAKQDAQNLKKGPLWAAKVGGRERRHIKKWYWLQIKHVPVSSQLRGAEQHTEMSKCSDWKLAHIHLWTQNRHLCDARTRLVFVSTNWTLTLTLSEFTVGLIKCKTTLG